MRTPSLKLIPEQSLILCVDVQERLSQAMHPESFICIKKRIVSLVKTANLLQIPVMVSEQYPKGLGPTVPEIRNALSPATKVLEKIEFSAWANPNLARELPHQARKQVILCGLETHVCIFQTARDLQAQGYSVFIPHDATLARHRGDYEWGLSLCEQAGALVTTTESILYDWLKRAGTPEFKQVSTMLKEFDQEMARLKEDRLG